MLRFWRLEAHISEMVKLRSERVTIILNAAFAPPIFQRGEIPVRFFDLIYSSLTPKFTVDSNDLQVLHGNSLGDAVVKYNIFGGNSTISMSADKLSAEFPMALPSDYQIIEQLLYAIGAGFCEKFPNSKIIQVQASGHEHASVVSGGTAREYLAQFEIPAVNSRFRELGASYTPGARFMISGNKAAWQALCSLEQSLYLADGLFLNYDVTLKGIDPGETLDVHMKRVKTIMEECASALELNFE